MAIDLDSINERVLRLSGQSGEKAATDYSKVRADFSALAASKAKTIKPTVEPESGFKVETKRIVDDVARGTINNLVAASFDAFGQFDKADELRNYSESRFARVGEAPVFGEMPGGRFVKESIFENLPQMGASLALLAIPVVGAPLAVASVFIPIYGESRRQIKDGTGIDQPYAAFTPATFNAAIEFNPLGKIANRLGIRNVFSKAIKDQIKADHRSGFLNRVKDLGKFTGEIAIKEGLIEVAQNASNLATVRFLTDKDILGKLDDNQKNEMWAGFWGGFAAGGAIGAVSAGYSQYKVETYIGDLKQQEQLIEAALNSLQSRKAQAAEQAPISHSEAAKAVIASALPQDAPLSVTPSANVQGEASPVSPTPPATSENPLADLVAEQNNQLLNFLETLPEHDMNIAVMSAQERLAQVKQEISFYEQRIEAEGQGEFLELDEQTHQQAMQFARKFEVQPGNRKHFSPFFAKANKGISVKDGVPIEYTIPKTEADFDVNDGLVVIKEDGVTLTNAQAVELYESSQFVWEALGQMGLQVNPETGKPIRLFVSAQTRDKGAGIATAIDGTTLAVFINPKAMTEDRGILDVLLHEIGHEIAPLNYANLTKTQKTALNSQWLKARAASMTAGDYYNRFTPVYSGYSNSRDKILPVDQTDRTTESASEFLAESFRKAFLSLGKADEFNLRKTMPKVYTQLLKNYKQAYDMSKGHMESDIKTFKDYVKLQLLRKELTELESANEMRERDANAQETDTAKKIDVSEGKSDINESQEVAIERIRKDGPKKDTDHLVLMIDATGMKKEAANINDVVDINMGFLGDNLRGKAFRKLLTPLQIAEQAANKGFSQPTIYMELVQQMQVTKMRIIEKADSALRSWRALGKDKANEVSRLLYVISTKSDELKSRLTEDEISTIAASLNASPEAIAEWRKIDAMFQNMVDEIEAGMVYDAAKTYILDKAKAKEFRDLYMKADKAGRESLIETYTGKPLVDLTSADGLTNPLWDVLQQINGQTDGMRQKNYFPRARLGEYAVRVHSTKEGVEWEGAVAKNDNETLGFYAFDTEAEQKAFIKDISSSMGDGLRAYGYRMDSEVFAVMGLPAGIIEQVKRELPNLTQKQKEQLDDIAMQRSPGRRFLRHLTKRKGIAGYSEDAMRVFANYATSAATHMARTEHASDMAKAISDMEATIKNTPGDSVLVNDLNVIKDYFVKHFDYLMKPDNDWARLRAVGFLWYLGFNVKSAAVNFMQTPMVTYPVLAKHTSDANAVRRIAGAMRDATSIMRGKAHLTEGEAGAIQALIEAGLIDESMMSELAGMSEGNALKRLVPGMDLKSTLDKFAWAGGFGFRIGEKYNRYVAGLAAYRVAKDNGLEQEAAVKFARDTVQASQFEYSRWNRAEFMRGKKSVLFLFWQYMQHASYLSFGGKGSATAKRMWILALVIAGIEGLPFAEMIMNILDFSGTQIKKLLGHPNPRVALREDLRELILNIHDRPDDILKGMSYQWGLGPLHAASLLGIPIPNVSTRGSLSYGNPVQWFDQILDPTVSDNEKMVAQTVASILGPVGGIALTGIEAMNSKEVDAWKRWEKIAPVFMQNASQGARWLTRGEETARDLSTVVAFETPEQRAEAVFKAMGFQPTRLDQTRQQMRATQMPVLYLQARREALLRQLDYAIKTKNREGRKDVLDAIIAFNQDLAKSKIYAPLMIPSSTISSSLSGRMEKRAEKAAGIQQGTNAILIQKHNERLYPITAGEKK